MNGQEFIVGNYNEMTASPVMRGQSDSIADLQEANTTLQEANAALQTAMDVLLIQITTLQDRLQHYVLVPENLTTSPPVLPTLPAFTVS